MSAYTKLASGQGADRDQQAKRLVTGAKVYWEFEGDAWDPFHSSHRGVPEQGWPRVQAASQRRHLPGLSNGEI